MATDDVSVQYCNNCKAQTIHGKKCPEPGTFIWCCMMCGNDRRDGGGNEPAELVGGPTKGGGYAA